MCFNVSGNISPSWPNGQDLILADYLKMPLSRAAVLIQSSGQQANCSLAVIRQLDKSLG